MSPESIRELSNLFAKMFIQRKDVVAVQFANAEASGYMPLIDRDKHYIPWSRDLLIAHLSGTRTLGHYIVGQDDTAKLLTIDIDLKKAGWLPRVTLPTAPDSTDYDKWVSSFAFCPDLRAAWHDRANVAGRTYLKTQMRQLAGIFTALIHSFLNIHTAAAYSGNKGIHVYGFTGTQQASVVREATEFIMDTTSWARLTRGKNFYGDSRGPDMSYDDKGEPIETAFPAGADPFNFFNFHFEIFPKQTTLEGKKLGNLVRLPLGVNLLAPKNPTFFIDLASPLNQLQPVDPTWALTTDQPWGVLDQSA